MKKEQIKGTVEVTVYCATYNHEKYLKKTLDGLIQQKTYFKYIVIVHDDASTDGTPAIVREFAEKYPDIIHPIFQAENQYSKGISVYTNFVEPVIESEYVAVCEGDDYWTNENKLQIQYDYMKTHPKCSLCVHNTRMISEDGNILNKWFNYSLVDQDYTTNEVITAKGGGLFHTSSFFYRNADRRNMPIEFIIKGIGDYTAAIYLSTLGYVHFCSDVMSYYRTGSINSWIKDIHKNEAKFLIFNEGIIKGLKKIDDYTCGEFSKALQTTIKQYELDNFLYQRKKWWLLVKPGLWGASVEYLFKKVKEKHNRKIFITTDAQRERLVNQTGVS